MCSSRTIAFCGNGIFEPEGGREECDDGNNLNTDGCTNNCRLDPNFECENVPGQRTNCGVPTIIDESVEVVQTCRDSAFPLPGRRLSARVAAALVDTPFANAVTMADIIYTIVKT